MTSHTVGSVMPQEKGEIKRELKREDSKESVLPMGTSPAGSEHAAQL